MNISIEFFGRQRIITGIGAIDMPINGNSTVSHALEYVRARYPELPLEEKTVLLVVNQEVVSQDSVLYPDDIVAFLPAIGGG